MEREKKQNNKYIYFKKKNNLIINNINVKINIFFNLSKWKIKYQI